MATKILTAHDLSTGNVYSSVIANVGGLVIHITRAGSTNNAEIKCTIMSKDGDGNYTPIRDSLKNEINCRMTGNGDYRLSVPDVNAENIKVYVTVMDSSADGTLTIEANNVASSSQIVNSAGISSDVIIRTFAMTVTRPANTTAYAAGDVIGDVSAALTKFVNVAKAAGYGVYVKAVRIQTTDTGLAGKTIKLHFYNNSVTAISDNDAFAIVDANYSKRDGSTTVTMGTGNVAKVGMNNYVDLPLNPVGRDVHCVLETTEGFTPSGNSTLLYVYIKCFLTA